MDSRAWNVAPPGAASPLRRHFPADARPRAEGRREKRTATVTVSTLRVETTGSDRPVLEWSDQPGQKIEGQLTEIAGSLLRRAEESLRDNAVWVYGQRCQRYQAELVATERRKAEEERKRLEAIEARTVKIRDEVLALAQRLRTAEDIRALVASLRHHPEVSSTQGQAQFDVWAANALAVADSIDPMGCSLPQILDTLSGRGSEP